METFVAITPEKFMKVENSLVDDQTTKRWLESNNQRKIYEEAVAILREKLDEKIWSKLKL